jgi:Lon protease-like protein
MDRDRLMRSLKFYLANNAIKTDWAELENASNDQLLNGLSMACPFLPQEKQALLESPTPMELSKMMTTLIEMGMLNQNTQNMTCH